MSFNPNSLARRGFVPPGVYSVLVHKVEWGVSSSGNPMATLDCEIVAPETVATKNNGQVQVYRTGHQRFRAWWTFAINEYLGDNVDAMKKIGVQVEVDYESAAQMIDDIGAQLPEVLERKIIDCALASRPQFARKPLTQEDIAAGITEGDVLRDPATGKERVIGQNIQMQMSGICSAPRDSGAAF